ncbi:uridine kinase [Lentzea flava]|uniref:Uridine kinase n=1 Tax=Lentzea flava TaxID=103732 RepID=A0ABQ2UU79_9PSEU|nr:uridine kinase [Lentzea flava]MCP2201994.1 uridine kinase [Lentzea flava]GGU54182.1 uridine kinase [Lentzea flava]
MTFREIVWGVTRTGVLDAVADLLPVEGLVAVDGVDGAGKTTFCDDLAAVLRARGRTVVRASVDDFHHPRAIRYRRGKTSPEGFFLDSFDHERLVARLLVPFAAGHPFQRASHDLRTDEYVDAPFEVATPPAILLVDGVFLHRDELVDHWDFSVFLHVDFAVSVARMAVRDGSPSDPDDPRNRRYVEGQRLYLATCAPAARASLVIDYNDLAEPRVRTT